MTHRTTETRFYRQEMPRKNELVMVRVLSVTSTSSYVSLLEYKRMEGMLPHTELSRRRVRSIAKLTKPGKQMILQVLRLDDAKGYIDLSKKAVTTEEERQRCQDRYLRARAVTGMMRRLADMLKRDIQHIMEKIAWPLYESHGDAYTALKEALNKEEEILGELDLDLDMRRGLVQLIQQRMKPKIVKMQAEVSVTCYSQHGVEGIRAILRAGEEATNKSILITVKAVPIYLISADTDNREGMRRELKRVIQAIQEKTREYEGEVEIIQPPFVVNDRHDSGDEFDSDSDLV